VEITGVAELAIRGSHLPTCPRLVSLFRMGNQLNFVTCATEDARDEILRDSASLIDTNDFRKWYRDTVEALGPQAMTTIHNDMDKDIEELDVLLQRVAVVAGSYRKKKALLCPIRRVPPEIQLHIFEQVASKAREEETWTSMKSPNPESFLEGMLRVSSFDGGYGRHWEHPVASVCRQWRALLKTNQTFVAKISVNYWTSHRRMSSWLQSLNCALLDCRLDFSREDLTQQSHQDMVLEILRHVIRFGMLQFCGRFDLIKPFLTGSIASQVENLVSLSLEVTASDTLDEDLQGFRIELPRLHFLSVYDLFHPTYLRLRATRLEVLVLQPEQFSLPYLTALGGCFPSLKVLYVNSGSLNHQSSEAFPMPFSQLTDLHITLDLEGNGDVDHLPLLNHCRQLRVISVVYPQFYDGGQLTLPPSCATHFIFERHNVWEDAGDWVPSKMLKSLPNLRHLYLRDCPNHQWYEQSNEDMSTIQSANGEVVDYITEGGLPLLESITFENFAVYSESLVCWNSSANVGPWR
jgi:hypothetical protein